MKQTAQGQNNFTRNWIKYLERHRYFIFKWYHSVYIHLSSNKRKHFECKCLESQLLIPSKKIRSGPIAKNCFELNLYSLDVPSSCLKKPFKVKRYLHKDTKNGKTIFVCECVVNSGIFFIHAYKVHLNRKTKKRQIQQTWTGGGGGGILKRVFLWGACTI